jgi:septal ring factor EnvC (AmiA/AmiB activator)
MLISYSHRLQAENSVIAASLLSCLIFTILFSGIAAAETSVPVERRLLEQKKKIERVQKGISEHLLRVKKSKDKELNLLAELEKIDQKIIDAGLKLIQLKNEVKEQELLTREKERILNNTKKDKLILQQHMEKRLAAYYRLGDIGFLNVVFSADSLPDLLKFKEYFHHMLRNDRLMFSEYKGKIIELEKARKIYMAEKVRLDQAISKVKAQQQELNTIRQTRRKLLNRVSTEKKLYQRAIREMEKAAEELTRTITGLEQEFSDIQDQKNLQKIKAYPLEPFKKRKPAASRRFSVQKGKLPLPAPGKIIRRFGKSRDDKFKISTFANGIDIQTAPGAEIKAVFGGKIVFADFLRGYGKLIIIDHGEKYYSLLGGLGEINKKVGDWVKKGEIIGTASNHIGLLSQGLHLEIRYSSTPEDPLKWLDPAQVGFANKIK